ncbi:uncharacterized protein LOC133927765 [Phragmites australis]|uniref:uncharacterized protein LOC133927765 n=1 Tax=Phragmites australis TaxID=29695 RepID=UPI002D77FBA8|nr:uncharacterized protein LOC133927765 [Phragmites australis]
MVGPAATTVRCRIANSRPLLCTDRRWGKGGGTAHRRHEAGDLVAPLTTATVPVQDGSKATNTGKKKNREAYHRLEADGILRRASSNHAAASPASTGPRTSQQPCWAVRLPPPSSPEVTAGAAPPPHECRPNTGTARTAPPQAQSLLPHTGTARTAPPLLLPHERSRASRRPPLPPPHERRPNAAPSN